MPYVVTLHPYAHARKLFHYFFPSKPQQDTQYLPQSISLIIFYKFIRREIIFILKLGISHVYS